MASVAHVNYSSAFPRKLPMWKRSMDIIGATLGLLIFSPLFLLLTLYIKVVSHGPGIYSSRRVGYGGQEFTMFKFRTMHVGGDSAIHSEHVKSLIRESRESSGGSEKPMEKLDKDPRLIPLAVLIRKTCIDELPQFMNILLGDMSLVGPRPALRYETDEYLVWHRTRMNVVPGMTGLWQVSGKNCLTFREMVALDIRYSRALALSLDLKIIALTMPAILLQIADYLAGGRVKNV